MFFLLLPFKHFPSLLTCSPFLPPTRGVLFPVTPSLFSVPKWLSGDSCRFQQYFFSFSPPFLRVSLLPAMPPLLLVIYSSFSLLSRDPSLLSKALALVQRGSKRFFSFLSDNFFITVFRRHKTSLFPPSYLSDQFDFTIPGVKHVTFFLPDLCRGIPPSLVNFFLLFLSCSLSSPLHFFASISALRAETGARFFLSSGRFFIITFLPLTSDPKSRIQQHPAVAFPFPFERIAKLLIQ